VQNSAKVFLLVFPPVKMIDPLGRDLSSIFSITSVQTFFKAQIVRTGIAHCLHKLQKSHYVVQQRNSLVPKFQMIIFSNLSAEGGGSSSKRIAVMISV